MSKLEMVNITEKSLTRRRALARGEVNLSSRTVKLLREGRIPKGDVLTCAKVAGITAVKRTPYLIPLSHPLQVTGVKVEFELKEGKVEIEVEVETRDRTGVEMEALTGVSVAALTIYDMCKGVDKGITISSIRLVEKEGGKSGHFTGEEK